MNDIITRSMEVIDDNTMPGGGVSPNKEIFKASEFAWDTDIAALGLGSYDPHRAAGLLLRYVARGQWLDGRIPNEIATGATNPLTEAVQKRVFNSQNNPLAPEGVITSGIPQPPVNAIAAAEVGQHLPAAERTLAYSKLFPHLKRQAQWYFNERVDDEDGLLIGVHAFESGMDNTDPWQTRMTEQWLNPHSPLERIAQHVGVAAITAGRKLFTDGRGVHLYERASSSNILANYLQTRRLSMHNYNTAAALADPAIVRIKDVATNAIAARASSALFHIEAELNDPAFQLEPELKAKMQRQQAAIDNELWDEETRAYYSKEARTGRLIRTKTIGSLLPLLNDIPDERAKLVVESFTDPAEFGGDCPGMPLNSKGFRATEYWLGPVWPFPRTLMALALRTHGFDAELHDFTQKVLTRPSERLKSEYEHPLTGAPLGTSRFTPTAAMDLYMAHINEQQNAA